MAISLKTAGTWATITGDAAVTIPGTPADGDRMFLHAHWKDFAVTATVSGWTEITEFADGSVGTGNGVGSMKVGCWYRDWQSGDSNPTLDLSAGVIGGAVINLWQKGASETWDTPTFATAAGAAADPFTATASSNLDIESGAVVFAHVALRDDSSVMTWNVTTGLDDDGSPAITWNGNTTGAPSGHHTTTTGNDCAGDVNYRLVTTGANGVTLIATVDISAAETGAVLFIHQGISTGGVTVTPSPVTIPLVIATPSLQVGRNMTPSPVTIPLVIPTPTIASGRIVTPSPVTIPLVIPTPTVTAGAGATTVTPDPVAIPLVIATPSLQVGALVTPNPVAIPLAIPTPTIAAGRIVTPSPVAIPLIVPSPAIAIGTRLTPDPIAILLALPTPTLNIGGGPVTVTPDPVVIALAIPIPTVVAGGAIPAGFLDELLELAVAGDLVTVEDIDGASAGMVIVVTIAGVEVDAGGVLELEVEG